ncbi:hypothetical protein [Helicobacter sp. 11S03491-1]|uniref:hypothetical protein n=1 Tax=Helicobacter sp. 11S03491-1 TaxID=1476196 RepID=UPI000BA6847B|nr:hypothetical protein [Helicobacter sp. 11S03491-1]PAF42593.1 hypothetical protein BKH45_03505 [Helicobacter sp. 11S03491-1]
MKYFYTLLISLIFLAGCETQNHHKNQITYRFNDQNQNSIRIQTNFDTLNIDTKASRENQDMDKITLIMFLDLNSQNAKDYIFNINHLRLTFPKAYIVGILTNPVPQEQVDEYIQKNQVNFPILNPGDNKNLFFDFAKKINTIDNPPQTQATDAQIPTLEIPYFVLYDKHANKYQTYSGFIPEEMFAYDIGVLSKKY